MAIDWRADDINEVQADLAQARAIANGVRIDLAARVKRDDGTVQAESVLRLDLTPQLARQMLTLLNRLVIDLEAARKGGRAST